jgi:structural maintenance of chromosome 1
MEKKGTVVAKLQEQLSHTQKQQSETEKKRAAAEKEYAAQQEQQKSLQAEIEDVNKTLARLEVAEADEGGELHLEVAQIAEYQKLKNQANTATNTLTREADGLRREHETLKERHSHLDNSVQTLTDRLKESQLCAQRLSQRKDEMERTIVESDKDLASLRAKFDAENEAIRSTSDKKAELENSIDALNAALADSKASRRDNEREQKLSEAVEQMKRLYPGVLGRLVDLCRPTQHKYGMAVQVGLGKNMEAIIVDTDQTARDGIAYLKEQRVGVATFIPHHSVRAEPVKDSMRELGGTVKPLLDVINFDQDEAVQRALLYAIGNTLVCDTLDEARRLAYGDKNKRYKIVVLDGTLLSRNGNITGGGQVGDDSHRSSSWDERDYQRNKAERDRLVKERSELDRGHRNDQLHAMRLQMSNLENRMANMKIDVQMSAEKLAKEIKEQAGIQAELTTKAQLESTARAQFAEVAGKLEALEARIRKEHEKIFRDFSKKVGVQHVHEYEQSRLSAIQKRTQQRVNLTDQKSKLENQLQYEASRDVAKQLETIQQKLVELQKSVDAQQKELEKTKKQDGKQECDAMAAQVKERQDEEDKVDAQIKRSRASNQQIFKDVHAIEKNLISREAIIDKLNTVRREFLRRSEMESIQLPVTKKKIKSKAAADIRGRAKKARTVAQRRRGRGEAEDSESEEEGDAMDVDNEAADAGEGI